MCDQVAERLSGLISSPVRFADDCVGPSVRAQVEEMSDGEVSYTVNGCECTLLLSILANLVVMIDTSLASGQRLAATRRAMLCVCHNPGDI